MALQQEEALVWYGGGRRFFTKRAAARAEALRILKDHFKASGDDPHEVEPPVFMGWVSILADLIYRAKPWDVDIGRDAWVISPDRSKAAA